MPLSSSSPARRIRLIARADDAGSTRGATDAIFQTVTEGIVRNLGIMLCCPAAEYAAERLRSLGDEICLGLHATITSEWSGLRWGPVSAPGDVPFLVEKDGTFVRNPLLIHDRGEHEKAKDQIMRELTAQLEKARRLRLNLQYIDCHMGFAWLPGVDEALCEFGRREGLIVHSRDQFQRLPSPKEGSAWERLRTGLETATAGAYVSVYHPCNADEASAGMLHPDGSSPIAERAEEARMLCAKETTDWISANGIELIRYTDAVK